MNPAMVTSRFCSGQLERLLVDLRHDLHRDPELSLQETRTARRLEAALSRIHLDSIRRVAGTGIAARLAGQDPTAPVVAIRGDIDALPIQEETGVEYASRNAGVMHACGHDVHAAWTVGAAHLLAINPAAGDVLILLQPAEETGRGAPLLIEEGVLDRVGAIFGAHVDMRFPIGQVVAEPGNVAASADEFSVELVGRGSHAARPHEGRDPIVAAASLVVDLQTIVSRLVSPGTPAVVTVGSMRAGDAPNVIPDRALLRGTLRAADPEVRDRLHEELRRMSDRVAAAHGVSAHVSILDGTPPLINEARCAAWARDAVTALLGAEALVPLPEPNMGGEDFAHYLERVPGCFLRIGSRGSAQEPIPAHTGRFLPADEAICIGSAVLAEVARHASQSLAS